MASGLHHYYKRKKKGKDYPHKNKWFSLMDKIIYLVAVSGPLVTLPQVLKIWIEQSASGVSLISWGGYLIGSFFWIVYGFMHDEKPIILANLLWVVFTALIVIGVVVYG
ncbi:hypothetical protein HOE04_03480 [archaeon]|jgi:uncharacterized protein with PQ loop repeat|nr:hypothetical protein [archaeon]